MEIPKDYFYFHKRFLHYIGLSLLENNSLAYNIFSGIFLVTTFFIYICVDIAECYYKRADATSLIGILSFLTSHSNGICKVIVFIYNRKKIIYLLKAIESGIFEPNVHRGGEFEIIAVNKAIKTTKKMAYIFFTGVTTFLASGYMCSIQTRLIKTPDLWEMPLHPMTVFGLINIQNSPQFELVSFLQYFFCSHIAYIVVTTDLLITGIMVHCHTQLKILHHCVRNIKPRGNALTNNDQQKNVYTCLSDSIRHHTEIIKITDLIEDLFKYVVLSLFFVNIFSLCLTIYTSSAIKYDSLRVLSYPIFLFMLSYQTGMYCYWGGEITDASILVSNATYDSDWVELDNRVKKAIIILMARTEHPIKLTAGKFFQLQMDLFVKILKGAFYFYRILAESKTQ